RRSRRWPCRTDRSRAPPSPSWSRSRCATCPRLSCGPAQSRAGRSCSRSLLSGVRGRTRRASSRRACARRPWGSSPAPWRRSRSRGASRSPRSRRRLRARSRRPSLKAVAAAGCADAPQARGGAAGGTARGEGGPDPNRLLAELGATLPPWTRRIDLVALTHAHIDHAAGLLAVLERYEVGLAIEPVGLNAGPVADAWNDRIARGGIARRALAAGARLRLGDASISVLAPEE